MKLAGRWGLSLILLVTALTSAAAAQKDAAPKDTAEGKVEIRRDQCYANNTNARQALDLYLPTQRHTDKPLPMVVYIHGGGWIAGSKDGFRAAATNQATSGMRMMGIRLDRLDGRPVDGLLAVVHSVLFWAGNVVLTPLILLVSLFADRKRTLHDLLLGTVVTRSDR